MQVYFLRHGLATERADWTGGDFDRPLTNEGKKKMREEAVGIARLELGLNRIVTSPYTRAGETAKIVAEKIGLVSRVEIDKRLAPGFSWQAFSEIVAQIQNTSALMLVGHEPDFSEIIGRTLGGARVECKKGSLAGIRLDLGSLRGELICLIPPRALMRT